MVLYFGEPTLLKGLEVISLRANLELGRENRRLNELLSQEIEVQIARPGDELTYSKAHLDLHEYSEKGLESEMASAQQELDKKERELINAEGNLLGSFNEILTSSSSAYLLELQLLQASANRAYAWSKLSFAHFTIQYGDAPE